jgi:hypothetical protein
MDNLVYALWILGLSGGIFLKMGFACWNFLEASILTFQQSFNLTSWFANTIMWIGSLNPTSFHVPSYDDATTTSRVVAYISDPRLPTCLTEQHYIVGGA